MLGDLIRLLSPFLVGVGVGVLFAPKPKVTQCVPDPFLTCVGRWLVKMITDNAFQHKMSGLEFKHSGKIEHEGEIYSVSVERVGEKT